MFLLSHAHAFNEPRALTLTPTAGMNIYDSGAQLNTGPTLGLKLDYGISAGSSGSIGLEGVATATQLKSSTGNGSAGTFSLRLGPLFCFPDVGKVTPFMTADLGAQFASSNVNSMPGITSFMSLGLGASYAISKQMAVRADLNRLFVFNVHGSSGFEMTLGLSYVVGNVKESTPLVESTPSPVVKRRKRGTKEAKAAPAKQAAPEAVQPATATAGGQKATPGVPEVAAKTPIRPAAKSVPDEVKAPAPAVEATAAAGEAAPAVIPAAPATEAAIPETKDAGAEPALSEVQSVMTARQKVRSAAPSPVAETVTGSSPVPAPAPDSEAALAQAPVSVTEAAPAEVIRHPETASAVPEPAPAQTAPVPAATRPEAKEAGTIAAEPELPEAVQSVMAAKQKVRPAAPSPVAETAAESAPAPVHAPDSKEAHAQATVTPEAAPAIPAPIPPAQVTAVAAPEKAKPEPTGTDTIPAKPALPESVQSVVIPEQKAQQDVPAPTSPSTAEAGTAPSPRKAETKEAEPIVSAPVTPVPVPAVPKAEAGTPETKEAGAPETPAPAIRRTGAQALLLTSAMETTSTPAAEKPETAPIITSPLAPTPTPVPLQATPAPAAAQPEAQETGAVAANTALGEEALPVSAALQKAKTESPAPLEEADRVQKATPAAEAGKTETKKAGAISAAPVPLETDKHAVIPVRKTQPEEAVAPDSPISTQASAVEDTTASAPGKAELKESMPVVSIPVAPAPAQAGLTPVVKPEAKETGTVAAKAALGEEAQPVQAAEQKATPEAPAPAREEAAVQKTIPVAEAGKPAPSEAGAIVAKPALQETTPALAPADEPEPPSATGKPETAPMAEAVRPEAKEAGVVAAMKNAAPEAPATVAESAATQSSILPSAAEAAPAPAPGKAEVKEAMPVVSAPGMEAPVPTVSLPETIKIEAGEAGAVAARPALPETAQPAGAAEQKAKPQVTAPMAEPAAAPAPAPASAATPAQAPLTQEVVPATTAPAATTATPVPTQFAPAASPALPEATQPAPAAEQKAKPEALAIVAPAAPAAAVAEPETKETGAVAAKPTLPETAQPAVEPEQKTQLEKVATAGSPAPTPAPAKEAAPVTSAPVQAPTASAALTPVDQAESGAQSGAEPLMEELLTDENEPSLRGLRNVKAAMTIRFASGKSTVDRSYHGRLRKIAAMVKADPGLRIRIAAHTDNLGNAHANYLFSQKRARSVKDYFVKTLGVDARRVSAKGYGHYQPVADNATAEGRRKNRRVVTIVLTTE